MRFSAVALAFLAAGVSASCNSWANGIVDGNYGKDISDETWKTACNSLVKDYDSYWDQRSCVMDSEGRRWELRIFNNNGASRHMNYQNCRHNMGLGGKGCKYGGEEDHDGWLYQITPRLGDCTNVG